MHIIEHMTFQPHGGINMDKILKQNYHIVTDTLTKAKIYQHAAAVLQFDMETICPSKGMEAQGEVSAFIGTEGYKLIKAQEFIDAAEYCYEHRFGSGNAEAPAEDGLEYKARIMIESLHRHYAKTKNVSPEKNHEWQLLSNRSYVKWLEAREAKDFSVYAPVFEEVKNMNFEQIELREEKLPVAYDNLLDDYERGITSADIDEWFGRCKERLLPLLEKIKASKRTIRTDFLSRRMDEGKQALLARRLLELMNYDFSRGAFTTTEHPFTMGLARNDIRVTTRYRLNEFASSLYSIVHEGGHALFSMLQPEENFDFFIDDDMTMGMHESVSRFYENRIGRSEGFIHLIYPEIRSIDSELLKDVSEEELYRGINLVRPSFIRTEADELTYTLHIIIRYELEKDLMSGRLAVKDLPEAWNNKYEEYLGIRPAHDTEGVLQDVHWTWGYGYFPTYALGNMYNAMYYNRLAKEVDIDHEVRSGNIACINSWMAENVFKNACCLTPKEWIRDITGREITPDDFLDYLEAKYGDLYL